MIELYTAPTGNGYRAAIAVAEAGLPYSAHIVDLAAGEQRLPSYLALNPVGQVPTIVDHDGPDGRPLIVTQSGAIMLYLAEKTGRHLPVGGVERIRVLERFIQVCSDVAGINATLTLADERMAEPHAPTLDYFEQLLRHHFLAFNDILKRHAWLAGAISIADLALYPHVVRRSSLIEACRFEWLIGWRERMAERPGVQLGMRIPAQRYEKDKRCRG